MPRYDLTSVFFSFYSINFCLLKSGGAQINGDVYVDLEPGGMDDPSMAIFNNISFSRGYLVFFFKKLIFYFVIFF
jgi:hypothetical protein